MEKYILVDTSYLIYRSYFAHARLTFDGKPTGAFYGFARTILKLIIDLKPTGVIFALDTPEKTWRHNEFEGYKALRTPPDPEMIYQIPIIEQWCGLITPNTFKKIGFEADDIIFDSTKKILLNEPLQIEQKNSRIDRMLEESGGILDEAVDSAKFSTQKSEKEVVIFSSDRDLLQLFVYPGVSFIQGKVEKREYNKFDLSEFEEKYNVKPQMWVDYKALVGDSSDNLPGISGIGPKGAAKILHEGGSLFYLYKALGLDNSRFRPVLDDGDVVSKAEDYIKKNEAVAKKLVENFESVIITYTLATLSDIADLPPIRKEIKLEKGLSLFREYGFTSLVRDVELYLSLQKSPEELF